MMRGCVAFLLLSLIAVPALPQCNYQLVYSGQFRTSALDLALDGNNLWLATGYGISLFDRSVDPPALVTSVAVPGVTRVVRAANGTAFAGSGTSIDVITRNGKRLQIAKSVDTGATVNDLLINGIDLYAATAAGIQHYDVNSLQLLQSTFVTSNPNVQSLAIDGNTLYAADGDASVEVFDLSIPTLPQHTGTISSLPQSSSVQVAGGKLFVSDGRQTQIFAASTPLAAVASGATSVAPLTGNVVFMAGNDLHLFARDFTSAANSIELFRADIAPSGGTINRITALATTSTRLYAAAGDAGLLTWDISAFTPPFAQRSYALSGTTSIVATTNDIYVGRTTAGIVEFLQNAGGSLTQARGWDNHVDVVLDTENGFLLTSSGSTATEWALQTASVVTSATLRSRVIAGVLIGQTGYLLLADNTLWSVDFSQLAPAPQQVSTGTMLPTSLAGSGSTLAIAAGNDDGTTSIGYYADPTKAPQIVNIPGIATTPVALSNGTAAVYTFSGVNLVSFPAGTTTTIAPAGGVARQLLLTPSTLFETTDDTLYVIDRASSRVTRQFTLPSTPLAVVQPPGTSLVDVVTGDGIVTVAYTAAAKTPALIPSINGNAYYKKVAGGGARFALFDGRKIDVFTSALQYVTSIRPAGIVDFAFLDDGSVVTLQNNGTVAMFTGDGVQIGGIQLSAAADAQWQWINTVNGTVWVAVTQGCSSGACIEQTLVLDPHVSLQKTATLSGTIKAVSPGGARVFVLVDIPSEIRVYSVGNPTMPDLVASQPTEGARPPQSISAFYVLGEKLYQYSDTLQKTGEFLGDFAGDPNGTTYADQRVAVNGNCGFVTGRAPGPQFFSLPSWTPTATLPVPAAVRSIWFYAQELFLLTDDSLEIWSPSPLPKPARQHPGR